VVSTMSEKGKFSELGKVSGPDGLACGNSLGKGKKGGERRTGEHFVVMIGGALDRNTFAV